MQPLNTLVELCRQRGVKVTPQRLAIFESLAIHGGHPTAEEVYLHVLRRFPTLSFATVYNTLELLSRMGEVREVIVDELRRRYDVNTEPHQHAVCRRCRRIVDVPPDEARALLGRVDLSAYDFTVENATVEFSGLCGACQRAPTSA